MCIQNIRLIKHEAVLDCGSFEVRFADGKPSRYFYWDDLPSRRLRPELLTRETALDVAREVARAARDEMYAARPLARSQRSDWRRPPERQPFPSLFSSRQNEEQRGSIGADQENRACDREREKRVTWKGNIHRAPPMRDACAFHIRRGALSKFETVA
ncbi:hypothetical protein XH99_01495 [Bradyrhizobium nanningense]|uniref:Uncharacterized protein n=1 Tax=Bradyrhizobium nanningense TaxID=1325118 RepID=A0A4Q0SIP0_9BRAD|nr:hypothetical protein XH84_33390 [Bradyrhizobium nanningense]RXH38440.1 hypothetical protein XH99_01495 [Bradyrhizobium nanningense]